MEKSDAWYDYSALLWRHITHLSLGTAQTANNFAEQPNFSRYHDCLPSYLFTSNASP